jgi:hypothetical protein
MLNYPSEQQIGPLGQALRVDLHFCPRPFFRINSIEHPITKHIIRENKPSPKKYSQSLGEIFTIPAFTKEFISWH